MKFTEEMMDERVRVMCEDDFWGPIYRNAPDGAKRRLRVAFWASKGLDEKEDLDEYRCYREEVESTMTYEDAEYLAKNFPEGAGKTHYLEMCERLRFASLRTEEKLDEAIDIMARMMSPEDREAVELSRDAFKGCDDPWVKYEWLWEAVGGKGDQCCLVGDVFDHGHGVERDGKLAEFWFRRGALCGDGDSCCRLAALYGDESEACFDFSLANFWYREALRRGNFMVKWALGYRLIFGDGAWKNARNPKLGVKLLESGLDDDKDGECHYYLGRCYEEGVGVKKNAGRALRLYQKAARRDHNKAKEAILRIRKENEQ